MKIFEPSFRNDSHKSYRPWQSFIIRKRAVPLIKFGRTGRILPRGTLHISFGKDKHRAYRREYHIRLYWNWVEYCESYFDSARACHVTDVRYWQRSAVFCNYLQCLLEFRTTARISFTAGNPWNLGCDLYCTEIAVILTVPHTTLLPQKENEIFVTE